MASARKETLTLTATGPMSKFTDTKTARYKALTESMKRQLGGSLRVGLVGEKADEPHENRPDLTVGELGTILEYGGEGLPARPFIRSYFDENYTRIMAMIRQVTLEAFRSNRPAEALAAGLRQVGQKLAGEIQGRILRGDYTTNAQSTVARKGFNAPLIEEGQLYAAISYELNGLAGTVSV